MGGNGRVSTGTGVVGLLDFQVLEDWYTKYESYGRLSAKCEHSVGLNLFKFQKMLRDIRLFPDKPEQAKLLFEAIVPDGERMNFDEYLHIIVDVAEEFFPHTTCNETALHHFITKYLSNNQRIGMDFEKLSSTSSFTTHGSCGPHVLPWDKLEEYSMFKVKRGMEETDVGRKLAVNFVETSLSALQTIYNVYAKHWCCAGHERSLRTRWRWRSSVCYGGFQKFLKESCLIERCGPESHCHGDGNDVSSVETDEALENEFSEQAIKSVFYKLVEKNNGVITLNFWQFVTGISAVVGDEAEQEGKSSVMVIEKMLENCVQFADTLSEREALDDALPRDLLSEDVSSLLHQNDHFFRPIFASYASTLVAKLNKSNTVSILSSCKGGGGFTPVLSVKGLRSLCSDFELIPRFTTLRKIQEFASSSPVPGKNVITCEAHVTYRQFLLFLVKSSEMGLSKYPLRAEETTKLEKMRMLLERMVCSQGVASVFDKGRVTLDKRVEKETESNESRRNNSASVDEQKGDKTQEQASSNSSLIEVPSSLPEDMTPMKAVNALDCFDALKARYVLEEPFELVQQRTPTAKSRQAKDIVGTRPKMGKSKLYRLGSSSCGKNVTTRKVASTSRIWTGKPRTKPRKPRRRAGGRLVFNPAFREHRKHLKEKRLKNQLESYSSLSSNESWCDSHARTAPGELVESVASCESWWDTRSALSIEERIELALQRT